MLVMGLFVVPFALPLLTSPLKAEPDFSMAEYRVVEHELSDLERLAGIPLEEISLVAIKDNKVHSIPFQIDEYDINGDVYFSGNADPRWPY